MLCILLFLQVVLWELMRTFFFLLGIYVEPLSHRMALCENFKESSDHFFFTASLVLVLTSVTLL